MSGTVLALDGIGKAYRRGQTQRRMVLDDVSFLVAAGEIVAVDAERRAGKTTLLRIAAGMETPDVGSVCFAGTDLKGLSPRARRALVGREIGWADRRGPRNPWRVIDYVCLPQTVGRGRSALQHAREHGLSALERVGAARCAPQQWSELADYEQVLVSLARLYAQRPRLIIADDLFDDLRVRGSVEVGDLLRSIVRELNCGVLASASDTEAALLADRVLALRKGRMTLRSDQSSAGEGTVISFPERLDASASR